MMGWLLSISAWAAAPPLVTVDLGHAGVPAFHGIEKVPDAAADAIGGQWSVSYGGEELSVHWEGLEGAPELAFLMTQSLGALDPALGHARGRITRTAVAGHEALRTGLDLAAVPGTPATLVLWVCPETHRLFVVVTAGADLDRRRKEVVARIECHGHAWSGERMFHAANRPAGWVIDDAPDAYVIRREDQRQFVTVNYGMDLPPSPQDWAQASAAGLREGLAGSGLLIDDLVIEPDAPTGARYSAVAEVRNSAGVAFLRTRMMLGACPRNPDVTLTLVDMWHVDLPDAEHVDPWTLVECTRGL